MDKQTINKIESKLYGYFDFENRIENLKEQLYYSSPDYDLSKPRVQTSQTDCKNGICNLIDSIVEAEKWKKIIEWSFSNYKHGEAMKDFYLFNIQPRMIAKGYLVNERTITRWREEFRQIIFKEILA